MFLVVFSEVFESWLNELNRAFFVFDPLRQAVVLCAGDKTGDKRFYKKMIPLAKAIYQKYLDQLEK